MSGSRGSRRNQLNRRASSKHVVGETSREFLEHMSESNPTIQLFQMYGRELDNKHDRFERIVKINRDITIESKRIIFLLHSIGTDIKGKKAQILEDAKLRLDELVSHFKRIADELRNQDHYLYLKAYTNGLQEYLEALMFYEYQRAEAIPRISEVLQKFQFIGAALECPAVEIMLGLTDFTGEMMRKCINNLGSGHIDDCFKTCGIVRSIYVGFLGLSLAGHNLVSRKLHVLKQSLNKMELVCYNIRVRGSEIPKHMLASVVTASEENADDDEGFY